MLPPSIKSNFDTNDTWSLALLLAYEQIRELEDIPDMDMFKMKGK